MRRLTALLFIITASICWGQDVSYTNRTDRALLAIDGAAKIADFYFTTTPRMPGEIQTICKINTSVGNYCYSGPVREANPIARPFVTHGRPLAAAYFASCFALDAVLSHELRKRGHPKLARAVVLFGIINNGSAAAMSARN